MEQSNKAAIYVRVSTLYQVDKDSLPLQKEELIAYSKFVLNISDYEIFEDAGYSGKNVERPGFQRMMSRVRTGEFSHILVWKIDRFGLCITIFRTERTRRYICKQKRAVRYQFRYGRGNAENNTCLCRIGATTNIRKSICGYAITS